MRPTTRLTDTDTDTDTFQMKFYGWFWVDHTYR